jgi:hypothetical protein
MAFESKRNDVSAFTQGAWVDIFGGRFRVARAGNPEYKKALEASGYRKADDEAERQRALYTAVAKGILKDWQDVLAEGEPVPFSIENAVVVMEENPDLVDRLIAEANSMENFRREDVDSQAKKRKSTSDS